MARKKDFTSEQIAAHVADHASMATSSKVDESKGLADYLPKQPLERSFNFRVTAEEYDYIRSYCANAGIKMADFFRAFINQHKAEHEEIYKQILEIRKSM